MAGGRQALPMSMFCPPPPPAPRREAVHTMLDADVSGAPVVDSEGRLVGVLSEKDLIWKVLGVAGGAPLGGRVVRWGGGW